MKIISNIFIGFVQFVIGYLFLFFGAFVGLGTVLNETGLVGPENTNPWWNTPLTFASFVITASFGVWVVGWLATKVHKTDFDAKKVWWRTFLGSAIGILIVSAMHFLFGAVGMLPILVAVIGAIIGYHVQPKLQN